MPEESRGRMGLGSVRRGLGMTAAKGIGAGELGRAWRGAG